jgi:hypothetical protein
MREGHGPGDVAGERFFDGESGSLASGRWSCGSLRSECVGVGGVENLYIAEHAQHQPRKGPEQRPVGRGRHGRDQQSVEVVPEGREDRSQESPVGDEHHRRRRRERRQHQRQRPRGSRGAEKGRSEAHGRDRDVGDVPLEELLGVEYLDTLTTPNSETPPVTVGRDLDPPFAPRGGRAAPPAPPSPLAPEYPARP